MPWPKSTKTARFRKGNLFSSTCPTRMVLDDVTSRWGSLVLVLLLAENSCRFSELAYLIGGVSDKMLAQTLRALEEDGFILRLFRIVSRRADARTGPPVLIQHGLLSNSATWVMNEEKSLPFFLAERGYDVWLGNIRCNYRMPHRKWKRHDPQYHSVRRAIG